MDKKVSTLAYNSNIQPIDQSVVNDTNYMTFVHDPFSLKEMKKKIGDGTIQYEPTDLQKKEMEYAVHCSYAFKDDYPWGTVIKNGEKKLVCKCLNQNCKLFKECRKDISSVDEEELKQDNSLLNRSIEKGRINDYSEIGRQFKEEITRKAFRKEDSILSNEEKNKDIFIPKTRGKLLNPLTCKEPFDQKNDANKNGIKKDKVDNELNINLVLDKYYSWLINNNYKESEAIQYRKTICSVNNFSRENNIWKNDIFFPDSKFKCEDFVNDKIIEFTNSQFYNKSMSEYITVLNNFAKFYSVIDKKVHSQRTGVKKDKSGITEKHNSKEKISSTVTIEINNVEKQKPESVLWKTTNIPSDFFDGFVNIKQKTVITEEPSERAIVNAGPGTGKTYALIEKLIYMVNDLNVDPEEILVLCFSRAAVEIIKKRLKKAYKNGKIGMNWNAIEIRTFDSFATRLLAYAEQEKLLDKGFSLEYLDYDQRIEKAINCLEMNNNLIENCRHLIVDEVQDLVTVRARFVMQLLKVLPEGSGYTLFGDACQSIYDYQVDNQEVNSERFFSWLFKTQSKSKYYSFGINYRQVSQLEELGQKYRNAILTGRDDDMKLTMDEIYSKVKSLDVRLSNTDSEELKNIFDNNRVGILTRTNGLALKISSWFKNNDIPHQVQKRLTDNALNVWIADIFRDYENDMIDFDTFEEICSEKKSININPGDVWNEIKRIQKEKSSKLPVEDILSEILTNGKSKVFFTDSDEKQITISNIHRSKGREFDDVILMDDLLKSGEKDNKNIQEHKVNYVAITRAKKEIFRTDIGKQYIYTNKKGDRRAYATGFCGTNKRYLTHIEVGRKGDLDILSFAEDEHIQKLFDNPLALIGEDIILKKNINSKKNRGYISYDIFLDNNRQIGSLGRTGKKFYSALNQIIKTVMKLYNQVEVYESIFPNYLTDIYIDNVISIINRVEPSAVAGKKFGNMMLWKGITISGFAKSVKDRY